jgi:hypothetical protein
MHDKVVHLAADWPPSPALSLPLILSDDVCLFYVASQPSGRMLLREAQIAHT